MIYLLRVRLPQSSWHSYRSPIRGTISAWSCAEVSGSGAAGVLARVGLQRICQMLQGEVAKAGWLATEPNPQPTQAVGVAQVRSNFCQ